jgi:hypothetical protein
MRYYRLTHPTIETLFDCKSLRLPSNYCPPIRLAALVYLITSLNKFLIPSMLVVLDVLQQCISFAL